VRGVRGQKKPGAAARLALRSVVSVALLAGAGLAMDQLVRPSMAQVGLPGDENRTPLSPSAADGLSRQSGLPEQVHTGSAALQPYYHDTLLAGDAAAQRALLKALASPDFVAESNALDQLFVSLQQQLDRQARVTRTRVPVTSADGTLHEQELLDLGGFSLISEGRYYVYWPEVDKVVELARQPPDDVLDLAREFGALKPGENGLVAIDPSGGSTLQLVVQAPTFPERVRQGGAVGYLIVLLATIGVGLATWRLFVLSRLERQTLLQSKDEDARADNPLGRILRRIQLNPGNDAESLNLTLDQVLLHEQDEINKGLPLLKLMAAIAPMLGLLGTVTGMIKTFQAIALHGSGDPKLMSGGISEALVTTVEGLVTAIPLLLFHSLLSSKAGRIGTILEAQGSAAIADRLDRDAGSAIRSEHAQPLDRVSA
jgi:biopolymer transport protein ExbB